mmetsp:Transcript_43754/g.52486  ORF Transcript_43754/g.52486 Transcript_43754/m.52486 type:complete len:94 (+) Transcript_43754:173-454(+)
MRRDKWGWGVNVLVHVHVGSDVVVLGGWRVGDDARWEEMLLRRSKEEIICLIRDIFFFFSGTSESSPNPLNSAVAGHTPPTPTVGETTEVSVW